MQSAGSIFSFIGGDCGFNSGTGKAPVSFSISENIKSHVEIIGCRAMDIWCAPSTTWRLIGRNRWRQVNDLNVKGIKIPDIVYYGDFVPLMDIEFQM